MSQEQKARPVEWWLAKRDQYVKHLDDGAIKIEEARAQGHDVTEWENYWLNVLMRRYEYICDKIRDLPAEAGA